MTPAERTEAWRRANPEKARALRRRYNLSKAAKESWKRRYASPHGRAGSLFRTCKKRAADKQLPFDLTAEWIRAAIERGHCEVTGICFDLQRAKWFKNPFGPSVDRVDPALGYTKANCRIVVECFNSARGEWGDGILKRLMEALNGKI